MLKVCPAVLTVCLSFMLVGCGNNSVNMKLTDAEIAEVKAMQLDLYRDWLGASEKDKLLSAAYFGKLGFEDLGWQESFPEKKIAKEIKDCLEKKVGDSEKSRKFAQTSDTETLELSAICAIERFDVRDWLAENKIE